VIGERSGFWRVFRMGVYRDRLQIIADILLITSRKSRKTQIMYQANLSHSLLCRYVKALTDADLIAAEDGDFYVLTGKGKTFLDLHETYLKKERLLRTRLECLEKERALLENMSCLANHFGDCSKKNPGRDWRQG